MAYSREEVAPDQRDRGHRSLLGIEPGHQLSWTVQLTADHGHDVVRGGAGVAERAADTGSRSALRPITGVSGSQRLGSRQEGGAEEHGVLQ